MPKIAISFDFKKRIEGCFRILLSFIVWCTSLHLFQNVNRKVKDGIWGEKAAGVPKS